jgi:DNA-directed RNA polymerase specialized sigma24 family protein
VVARSAGNGNVSVARWMSVGTQQLDFAEFYRSTADECLRTVLVSVGDQDAAQELVDEAFARAWAS